MTFTPRNMIVITGAGAYPRLVVEGARAAGVARVDVLAVRGSTARATCRAADHVHTIGIGEIASGLRWVAAQGYEGAVFAGHQCGTGHNQTVVGRVLGLQLGNAKGPQ